MNRNSIRTLAIMVLLSLFFNLFPCKNNVYGYNKIPKILQIQLEYPKLYEEDNQSIEVLTRYAGKVQYRIWLYSQKQNGWKEITENYTEAVDAKNIYRINLPKIGEGKYKISVWVKRADSESTYNERGYDNYSLIDFECVKNDFNIEKINVEDMIKDSYDVGQVVNIEDSKNSKFKLEVYDVLNGKNVYEDEDYNKDINWEINKNGIYILKIHVKKREELRKEKNINKEDETINEVVNDKDKNGNVEDKNIDKENEEADKEKVLEEEQSVNEEEGNVEEKNINRENENVDEEIESLNKEDENADEVYNSINIDKENKNTSKDNENVKKDINKEDDNLNQENKNEENDNVDTEDKNINEKYEDINKEVEEHNDKIEGIEIEKVEQEQNRKEVEDKNNIKYQEIQYDANKMIVVGELDFEHRAPKVDYLMVGNEYEGNKVFINSEPNLKSKTVGYIYGSLQGVTIIEKQGDFYYIEAKDYNSKKLVKGYVPCWRIKKAKPNESYSILVDLSDQTVYIFKDNENIKTILCSTGTDWTPTPTGYYMIGARGTSFTTKDGIVCHNWVRFSNDFLFHSVLFNTSGQLIQSSVDMLGNKASHGCIRLAVEDIEWFYDTIPEGSLVKIQE